jgi:hypothetical protein
MSGRKTHKGKFKPSNPKKYLGNVNNIIWRSTWELRFMRYLDQHPGVLEWASEEFAIPYESPVDGRMHRYYPDFILKKKNSSGDINILVVEIKPHKEMFPPMKKQKITKRFLEEAKTYSINQAKWEACDRFCKERNWEFVVMTENELYGKK